MKRKKHELKPVPDVPLCEHNLHVFQLWCCSSLLLKEIKLPMAFKHDCTLNFQAPRVQHLSKLDEQGLH